VIAIARNEEMAIDGFFAQFRAVTQDFCLLDTGSTDHTLAIARACGARVQSAPFEDFASARNQAIERFGEGADWIIMLDPDERLDAHTIGNIEAMTCNTPFDIFLAPLHAVHADGSRRAFVAKPFLFRHGRGHRLRWVFKVHEKLIGSMRQAVVRNAMIDHVIALHADGRRAAAAQGYDALTLQEPYFVDADYRKQMIEAWPILDYERADDARLAKIFFGPLISVVIPTYQRHELLTRAVRSALAQDYVNLEVLVVGDNDPQFDRILAYLPDDARIRAFNLPHNHGAGGAQPRNQALRMANGSFIAYLDDDNEWASDHVSSVYEAMRERDAAFGFSSMHVAGNDLFFTRPELHGIDTSCVIHRKDLIGKYGEWRDRTDMYPHDWELFSRWVAGGETWACTRKPTLEYNVAVNGQSMFMTGLVESRRHLHEQRLRREADARACELLAIDADAAPERRWAARARLPLHAHALAECCPAMRIHAIDLRWAAPLVATSASFVGQGDGYLGVVGVTSVYNSAMADADRGDRDGAHRAITRNFMVKLAADFTVIDTHAMQDRSALARFPRSLRRGFEGCRLFPWNDGWWCSAAAHDLLADGRAAMALLRLDAAFDIVDARALRGYADTLPQQNWMPLVDGRLRFVYSVGPAIVVDASAGDGSFVVESGVDPGVAIEHWRGGPPLLAWESGYLGVVRETADTPTGRLHTHRFVAMNASCVPIAVSDAFFLRDREAEWITGLATRDGDGELVIGFGAGTASAWLATLPRAAVRAMLRPVAPTITRWLHAN
jgi:glycosyltransferase involved in cell wall biosynthesis